MFLSYAREDRARAEQVAQGLEAAGVDVFWDNEIPPGQTWADYIESKLTHCKALIVLWSQTSTKSQWVREEARMGRDKGVLIPAMIDASQAPFGFGEVQAANLSSWTGDANHPDWRRFVEAVRAAASSGPRAAPPPMPSAPPRVQPAMSTPAAEAPKKGGVPTWAWIAGGVVGVLVLLGVLGSMIPDQPTTSAAVDTTQIAPVPNQPAATPQAAPATAADYQQQVMARLAQADQILAQQGFVRTGDPVTGQLEQGQGWNWPITLNVGHEFRVVGVCDNDCVDLDLALYDGYGNEISRDPAADATPMVGVIPTTSGQFTVQAHMFQCTQSPCFYALGLYAKAQ
ncbi:MAG: toll/interleukin-1 receptor domain-containing protein [Hyphomonadaceae bacterium]|nr:toll/interleukin-1 receptor domain-containing protein [Hyphomonadaceae bacterium]